MVQGDDEEWMEGGRGEGGGVEGRGREEKDWFEG